MKNQNKGDIVIYQTKDGLAKNDVRFDDETVWLTQAQLVELYKSSKANVSEHIKHIFEEGELAEESTVRKFRTVQIEDEREVSREQTFYNLDMIISLGYRIKSGIATQFRRWATEILEGTGFVSHKKALEKAEAEYQNYIQKNLSPVEQAYLDTIKTLEKEAKPKGKK